MPIDRSLDAWCFHCQTYMPEGASEDHASVCDACNESVGASSLLFPGPADGTARLADDSLVGCEFGSFPGGLPRSVADVLPFCGESGYPPIEDSEWQREFDEGIVHHSDPDYVVGLPVRVWYFHPDGRAS